MVVRNGRFLLYSEDCTYLLLHNSFTILGLSVCQQLSWDSAASSPSIGSVVLFSVFQAVTHS